MSEGRGISRRRLLAAGGLGVLGIGGFAAHNLSKLRFLGLQNTRERTERVQVRVMANGKTHLERFFEVDGKSRRQVPCDWPNLGWSYRYGARLDTENEWKEATISGGGNAFRRIWIEEDGIQLTQVIPGDGWAEQEYVTPCEGIL